MFLLNGLAFGTDPITYKYFLNELSNLFGGHLLKVWRIRLKFLTPMLLG